MLFQLSADTTSYSFFRVSSTVVQRYLKQILDAALDSNPQIQAAAIEVLTFTVKQGLAHPLQVCSLAKYGKHFLITFHYSPSLSLWLSRQTRISTSVAGPTCCIRSYTLNIPRFSMHDTSKAQNHPSTTSRSYGLEPSKVFSFPLYLRQR